MAAYNLYGRHHVDAWFDDHDLDECRAMALWIKAAIVDPYLVAHGVFEQARTRRRLYWALVPNTGSIVTYAVFEAPVRVLSIISIIPAPESQVS